MLPKQNAMARPQAIVLSDRKCPLRRSVISPNTAATAQVTTMASSRPSQGDCPPVVDNHAVE